MAYTNSPLVVYTNLSPNHSGQRTHSIDRITPHCVVGQLSAESICGCFISPSRQASCNYGIGKDGRVSLCVEEKNRSWCSSSAANDQRAITIECASDLTHPYAMNSAVYTSLIKLCTDMPNGLERWGLQSFLRNKISAQMIQPVISSYPSWQQWHRMKVILSVKMKRLLMQADLHEVSTISAIIVFSATTVWMASWFPTRTLGL